MRGLLLKDYYMIIRYCKAFLMIVAVFTCVSIVSNDNGFMMIYPGIITGMIPMTLMSYEERCHWTAYCETLPYSRRQVVISKYVLALLAVTAVSVFMAVMHCLPVMGRQTTLAAFLNLAAFLWMLSIAGPSLLLPFIFRLGVERGRGIYYVILALVCGLGTFFSITANGTDRQAVSLVMVQNGWTAGLMVVIGILLFFGSMALAIRFYERRDL